MVARVALSRDLNGGLWSTRVWASQKRAAIKALRDIEHRGQVLLQEGAVLLVRNKFDGLEW